MKNRDDIPGFDRRTVLKSAAVAAVGVGAFSGTASATIPEQINFCGCSQVCVYDEDNDNFQVVLAREPYELEDFKVVKSEDGDKLGDQFCYEIEEDSEWKVVGVMGASGGDNPSVCNPDAEEDGIYCNPGQCAQKALAALGDLSCDKGTEPRCLTPSEIEDDGVEIVLGRCGKPGRDAPPGRQ